MGRVKVTQVKSAISFEKDQGRTLKALGLRRLGDSAEHEDSPSLRGMIRKVSHLIKVEEMKASKR